MPARIPTPSVSESNAEEIGSEIVPEEASVEPSEENKSPFLLEQMLNEDLMEGELACPNCTYLNDSSKSKCEICDSDIRVLD